MTWTLPGAILFLLGMILLLGYFLSRKVFPPPREGGQGNEAGEDGAPANPCEGCEVPGCGGFGHALIRGGPDEAPQPPACPRTEPGGPGTGEAAASLPEQRAFVLCRGSGVPARYHYAGAPSCRAAASLAPPPKACWNACLGFGDCRNACPDRAIVLADGIAGIDPARCDGCGRCLPACPLDLIVLVPARGTIVLACKGPREPEIPGEVPCPDGCTACGACIEACPEGALVRTGSGLPRWLPDPCTDCGRCLEACPTGVLVSLPLR